MKNKEGGSIAARHRQLRAMSGFQAQIVQVYRGKGNGRTLATLELSSDHPD
jgi:hypothetical protein